MKNVLLFFLTFAIFITGCSKSKETGTSEFDYNRQIENKYGIKIPHRENLRIITGSSEESEIQEGDEVVDDILTVEGRINDFPWVGVFDLNTKKMIFEHEFKNDPKEVDFGYGNIVKMIGIPTISIKAKTETHVYGIRKYKYTGKILFVGEIGANTVTEYDIYKGNLSAVRSWFNNSVFISDELSNYKIMVTGNKVLLAGYLMNRDFEKSGFYHPVSYDKLISYYGGTTILVYSLIDNSIEVVTCNPRDNDNDRAEVVSVSSDGNIATIVFKITTFENKITEKKVKLDFENYVIVE